VTDPATAADGASTADREPAPDGPTRVPDVVPMRRRHLRAVLAIEADAYPRPWSSTLFLGELAQRATRSYFVALLDGRVVGYAGSMLTPDGAHVTTVAVDPDRRQNGIATMLMCTLHDDARERGADALTLEVRASNVAARRLYERFGYEAEGLRRRYYSDNGEDAVIMWVRDVDRPAHQALLAALRAGATASRVTGERG
jgi:ribosomal-protein-alanine N-acetyltransferase